MIAGGGRGLPLSCLFCSPAFPAFLPYLRSCFSCSPAFFSLTRIKPAGRWPATGTAGQRAGRPAAGGQAQAPLPREDTQGRRRASARSDQRVARRWQDRARASPPRGAQALVPACSWAFPGSHPSRGAAQRPTWRTFHTALIPHGLGARIQPAVLVSIYSVPQSRQAPAERN